MFFKILTWEHERCIKWKKARCRLVGGVCFSLVLKWEEEEMGADRYIKFVRKGR